MCVLSTIKKNSQYAVRWNTSIWIQPKKRKISEYWWQTRRKERMKNSSCPKALSFLFWQTWNSLFKSFTCISSQSKLWIFVTAKYKLISKTATTHECRRRLGHVKKVQKETFFFNMWISVFCSWFYSFNQISNVFGIFNFLICTLLFVMELERRLSLYGHCQLRYFLSLYFLI